MRLSRFLFLFVFIFECAIVSIAQNQYYKNISLRADSIITKKIKTDISSVAIEARVKVLQNKERAGRSKSSWRLMWDYRTPTDYKCIELTWNNTDYGDFLDTRQCIINIIEVNNSKYNLIKSICLEHGVNMSTGFNTILVEAENYKYSVFVGEDNLMYLGTYDKEDSFSGDCGLTSTVNSYVSNLIINAEIDVAKTLITKYDEEFLRSKFTLSRTDIEGFWSYLDRNNDPDWAKIGGRYKLALVKDGNDYLIIYIDGAEVNRMNWKDGMIKGRLKSTIFQNHYDVEWYDSMFELIDEEAHASVQDSILTIEFPLFKTQIRFYKGHN